ncbi:phosphotransferase [Arundinibacter roseus]|uniref:Homoserine kinase n=1 Tax=Arundinibacter roseus TaxID=2070510 RepID=A0A4R4KNG3_9BACT|nr:phosphotransferase [Arundinibacter roseus]TDB68101.1 homoserine kinase [Arundinibacter roseus]
MIPFPVTDSTLSSLHLGRFVAEHYNLGSETTCQIVRTGINHSYLITDQDKKYIFRVYSFNWRSREEVSEEIRLLNVLKNRGLSVSFPIPDSNHQFIQELSAPEGARFGVLFSFAPGKKERYFSLETCRSLGVTLGKFHEVMGTMELQRITYTSETLIRQPYQFATRFFSPELAEMQWIKKSEQSVEELFATASRLSLRHGAVHLDMWYDNMHILNEETHTIFDFDFCGNGYLLFDVAYFIMQLYHIEPNKELYQKRRKAFLSGYTAILPISAQELELLPEAGRALWIFYLGVQSQRFDNWSNVFLSENYLIRFIGMCKDWLSFHGIEE